MFMVLLSLPFQLPGVKESLLAGGSNRERRKEGKQKGQWRPRRETGRRKREGREREDSQTPRRPPAGITHSGQPRLLG